MADYLSVTEYAKLHREDSRNNRRLLASGHIPGEKVGKQWIIPSGAVYPEDKREKAEDITSGGNTQKNRTRGKF